MPSALNFIKPQEAMLTTGQVWELLVSWVKCTHLCLGPACLLSLAPQTHQSPALRGLELLSALAAVPCLFCPPGKLLFVL